MGALFMHRCTASRRNERLLDAGSPLLTFVGPWVFGQRAFGANFYYSKNGAYTDNRSCYCELTIPAGYTEIEFFGFMNGNGGSFDLSVNGVFAASGPLNSGDSDNGTYFRYALLPQVQAGDVVRFRQSGGFLLYFDTIFLR